MAKEIRIPYEGKEYVLTFTRRIVSLMEQDGFNLAEVENKPATMFPQLFAGAFRAKQPFVKPEIVDSIYKRISDKSGLFEKLSDMYAEVVEALFDEPEADEGNIQWKASW